MTIRQKPEFAYFQGAVRPYEGAVIHASSEDAGVDLSRRLYRATRINNEINEIVERGRKSVRLGGKAEARSDAAENPTGAAAC
jgi:hypothetical protein